MGLFPRRRNIFWRVFRQNVSAYRMLFYMFVIFWRVLRPNVSAYRMLFYMFVGRHLVLISLQIA